ncbi:unnamed protein product [Acanthosepion pharaonis]|uniref:Uncharacterized protein n=1 Tax=Acanthosepion pharaonis TaxID=158019 RepID=A0A812APH2_ACAPH|nr:unnamed protein product [Sepia pharaonis]
MLSFARVGVLSIVGVRVCLLQGSTSVYFRDRCLSIMEVGVCLLTRGRCLSIAGVGVRPLQEISVCQFPRLMSVYCACRRLSVGGATACPFHRSVFVYCGCRCLSVEGGRCLSVAEGPFQRSVSVYYGCRCLSISRVDVCLLQDVMSVHFRGRCLSIASVGVCLLQGVSVCPFQRSVSVYCGFRCLSFGLFFLFFSIYVAFSILCQFLC